MSSEEYELGIEADSPEDALLMAESTLETYPQGRTPAVRYCLRTNLATDEVEIIDVEAQDFDG